MRGYGQFCPVAKALEVVGGRWTPLVLRELMLGCHRFNDLQRGVPLMSRTLLAQRLRELEEAGVIVSVAKRRGRGHEYRLTMAGEALRPVIEQLSHWGQRHTQDRLRPEDFDPAMLLWNMRRHIDPASLPEARFVARFELRNLPRDKRSLRSWWLVLRRPEVDVCLKNPGFEVDAVVNADLALLTRTWLGYVGLAEAERSGAVRIAAAPAARKVLCDVLLLSPSPRPRPVSYGLPAVDRAAE